jgi:hypothetical protein
MFGYLSYNCIGQTSFKLIDRTDVHFRPAQALFMITSVQPELLLSRCVS